MARKLVVSEEAWPIAGVFRISRGARTESKIVLVRIEDNGVIGQGESAPNFRYDETVESAIAQIEAVRGEIEDGVSRSGLLSLLPSGAARNAVDCALWDLEAKQSGNSVEELAGISPMGPVTTVFTLSVDTPEAMGEAAAKNRDRPLLKLKMTGDGLDVERIRCIHDNAPNARLVVDANEAWSVELYKDYAPQLAPLGVEMIEQPLPAGDDDGLIGLARPIPVCADESCHDTGSLPDLVGKYDIINIKLDKTGGLTEALRLRDAAVDAGFEIMVGCMIGTSLAMAPGMVVAQGAKLVDLDAPLLLAKDREPGLHYDGSTIAPPKPELWG